MQQPSLYTPRLLLRPFNEDDAPRVQLLAGDRRVADTTINIPNPYPLEAAKVWINGHPQGYAEKSRVSYAICQLKTQQLVGTVSSFGIALQDARAEIGYWMGVDYWGAGYCTEALMALIQFLHEQLGITKVVGQCFARNIASQRVMLKAGFEQEGLLVKHLYKNGLSEDILIFGRLLPGR